MTKLLLALPLLALLACKPVHKSAKSVNNQKVNVEPTYTSVKASTAINDDPKKSLPDTIRLVVSFVSIGEGTDSQADSILKSVVTTFTSKTGVQPMYVWIPWGREGELDNCFLLKELTDAQQAEFIFELKTAFTGHKLVQVIENMKNRFRR